MNATQYMPFFLTGLFPCLVALIGILVNKHDFRIVREDAQEIKRTLDHLVDLHIDHAERIAWLEAKAGKS